MSRRVITGNYSRNRCPTNRPRICVQDVTYALQASAFGNFSHSSSSHTVRGHGPPLPPSFRRPGLTTASIQAQVTPGNFVFITFLFFTTTTTTAGARAPGSTTTPLPSAKGGDGVRGPVLSLQAACGLTSATRTQGLERPPDRLCIGARSQHGLRGPTDQRIGVG